MPVIYNKKVEYAYTDPGVKAHTLSWAEYQALSEDDKMNGDLYFIPDKQPEGNPSRIWTKLGTDPLTTQADDVSGAVNELNSSLTNVNIASVRRVSGTFTTGATGNIATGVTNDGSQYVVAPLTSGASVFLRAWVSGTNGGWYLTAIDPNTGATINNTQLAVRYLLVTLKTIV